MVCCHAIYVIRLTLACTCYKLVYVVPTSGHKTCHIVLLFLCGTSRQTPVLPKLCRFKSPNSLVRAVTNGHTKCCDINLGHVTSSVTVQVPETATSATVLTTAIPSYLQYT